MKTLRLFKISTDSDKTMTLPAKDEKQARIMFDATYAKSFGRLMTILEITSRRKQQVLELEAKKELA